MAASSDAGCLVLHVLRLKGFADLDTVAARACLGADEASAHLDEAVAAELATHRSGRITGWSLTPKGRQRHRDLITAELEESGRREFVEVAYKSFLSINTDLLEVCTAWQMKDGAMNDHTDAAYDREVISRLRRIDDAVQPVCADLASAVGRFGTYGPRLTEAIARIESGDGDWFTKPMIDSYHTVWFELHEDLLATLGIERSKEGST